MKDLKLSEAKNIQELSLKLMEGLFLVSPNFKPECKIIKNKNQELELQITIKNLNKYD